MAEQVLVRKTGYGPLVVNEWLQVLCRLGEGSLAFRDRASGQIVIARAYHDDAESVVRRQGEALDDEYVLTWLRRFEQALDDSTLVATYRRMRARWSRHSQENE